MSGINKFVVSQPKNTPPGTFEYPLTFSSGLTRNVNNVTNNLITGFTGGQTVIGDTASGGNLTLQSTSNATKGSINFGTSTYNELYNKLGIGITSKLVTLTAKSAADVSNVGGTTTANASTTITGVGTTFLSQFGIGDRVSLSSASSTYATITAIASDTSMTVSTALGNGTTQTLNRKSALFRLDTPSLAGAFTVSDQMFLGLGTANPLSMLNIEGATGVSKLFSIGSANLNTGLANVNGIPANTTFWNVQKFGGGGGGVWQIGVSKDGANVPGFVYQGIVAAASPAMPAILFTGTKGTNGVTKFAATEVVHIWGNGNAGGQDNYLSMYGNGHFIFSAAPGASANYGTVSIGSGGNWAGGGTNPFAGSSSGTSIAVNEVSGYAGDLMNLQVAGASKWKINKDGVPSTAGTAGVSGTFTTADLKTVTVTNGIITSIV